VTKCFVWKIVKNVRWNYLCFLTHTLKIFWVKTFLVGLI
jgi:hypothetical protein